MKLGIIRLYIGESGKVGYYNIQEIGLAKALAKRGIPTDIFFLVDKKNNKELVIKEINKMIRIIYMPAIKLFNHGIISPKFILDYNIDIVHLLSDNQLMVPSFIDFCNKHNIKVYNYVGAIVSDNKNKVKRTIINLISKRNIKWFKTSNIIAKTPAVKHELEKHKVRDVRVIPVGLDLSIIPNIYEDKKILREQLKIPVNKRVCIFVGRLENYKAPIKALELLKEIKNKNDEYMLIMIGSGTLKNNILNYIRKNKLYKSVILIDKIENSKIHKYYKASDIFINFNCNEIFGMSILEAMNQGCKVIAIDAPGPKYIIEDNISGFIINGYDTDKWINVIEKNIDNNEVSQLAMNRINEKFNWDIIVNKYITLFNELKGE